MAHSPTSTAINAATTGHHRSPTGHTIACGAARRRAGLIGARSVTQQRTQDMPCGGRDARCGPGSHCGGAAAVVGYCMAHRRPRSETSHPQAAGTAETLRRRRKRHCALIRRSAQVLEDHAPWSFAWTWTRRTRSAPNRPHPCPPLSTRNSPSTSEVTCTQNNMVNPADAVHQHMS